MTTPEKTAIASHAATIALCIVVGVCAIVLTVAALKITDGGQQALVAGNKGLAETNQALVTLNAPCVDNGHQITCGTLAAVNQAVKNSGILAAQAAEQVKQSGKLIAATTRNLDAVSLSVQTTMSSLSGTANVATESIHTLSAHSATAIDTANSTLGQLRTDLVPIQALVGNASLFVSDADKRVNSPDVDRFLKSTADTSQQFALMSIQWTAISTDIHKEADSITKPQPWYKKIYNYGNMGVNVACLATHSCPF